MARWKLSKIITSQGDRNFLILHLSISKSIQSLVLKAMKLCKGQVCIRCLYWIAQYRNLMNVAKSLQSCLTLCNPIDGSPPGSAVPGIFQARTLEWVAISFSNAWKWKGKVKSLSCVRLFATPWTQSTRLLRPWDFPGKGTGVGCHCLLQKSVLEYVKSSGFKLTKSATIL